MYSLIYTILQKLKNIYNFSLQKRCDIYLIRHPEETNYIYIYKYVTSITWSMLR